MPLQGLVQNVLQRELQGCGAAEALKLYKIVEMLLCTMAAAGAIVHGRHLQFLNYCCTCTTWLSCDYSSLPVCVA